MYKRQAIDVPERTSYEPPGAAEVISTPGATISGFPAINETGYPLPEKGAGCIVLELYAPTDIARLAVEGMVSVTSADGTRNDAVSYTHLYGI